VTLTLLIAPDASQLINAIDRLTLAQQKSAWDYISIISVIATLIVLIVYTIETYNLRRTAEEQIKVSLKQVAAANAQTKAAETQAATALEQITISQAQVDAAAKQLEELRRQTDNANRPLVIISFLSDRLHYDNIGNGPALNIVALPIQQDEHSLTLSGPDFLASRISAGAMLDLRTPGSSMSPTDKRATLRHNLLPLFRNSAIQVRLQYSSADNLSYYSICIMDLRNDDITLRFSDCGKV
jgi:hypothetical protein